MILVEPQDRDSPTPYELMGGEGGVRELVDRFYDLMDFEPGYRELRLVHGSTLESAREKLFLFLSGWLGGPPLYMDRYGHPMLRARHLPFAIGMLERDQWLACMAQAMEETHVVQALRKPLQEAFFKTADWMRNKPG
jgi:hemoglobin